MVSKLKLLKTQIDIYRDVSPKFCIFIATHCVSIPTLLKFNNKNVIQN